MALTGERARRADPVRFTSAGEAISDLAAVARSTPTLVRAYAGGLDPRLRERVMVAVSRANACAGCTRVHERWALHRGVGAEELAAIGLADLVSLDARSRAAAVFASERAALRFRAPPSNEVAAAAAEHLAPAELTQVEAVARAMALANLTVTTLAGRRARRLK